jgi:3-deoxy-D-manno-octulosonic-acid transferase
MRWLYGLLTYLLTPLLLAYLYWRSRSNPGYRQRIGERFGFGIPVQSQPSIWVHAASVGEVQAAAELIQRLLDRHPDVPLVVTTMTPTGSARVHDLFGNSVVHSYLPFDQPSAVRRFFDRTRPSIAIIMETELWPSLYHQCSRRSVPLVLASARVSTKSMQRYRRMLHLFRESLSQGVFVAAQTEADADRFRELGASAERTHVIGNIKFDFRLPEGVGQQGREFRRLHAPDRPVWIAASTHDGEEQAVLEAHRAVLAAHPDALMLWVPRHPERFPLVAGQLERAGMPFVTRSSGAYCSPQSQVFLGDSMGELTTFYAAADVAFVAGSLVPIGGHNLLEPAGLGIAALTGPYNFNAIDIADLLSQQGAVEILNDAEALAPALVRLLGDAQERERRGEAGLNAVAANRGALQRLMLLLEPILPEPATASTASTPTSR